MGWSSRQKRLREILSADNNLCFSVFAVVTENNVTNRGNFSAEQFEILQKKHGVDLKCGENFQFPKHRFGEIIHHGGYLFKTSQGEKLVEIATLAPLYTISPYKMPDDNHPEWGSAALDMHFIKNLYLPLIMEKFPDLELDDEDDYYVESGKLSVKIHYVVQPYNPSICHPRDLGVLNSLQLPDNILIVPPIKILPSVKELKTHHLRNQKFSLR